MADPESEAAAHGAESARLAALAAYGILDTPPETGFDDIVQLAREICEAPVALVSLVAADRQWFKAKVGLDACETPIEQSVCAHALKRPGLLVIPDLTRDERTRHNTLVTGDPYIRFYAGARLETADGHALGTLCVIDREPRAGGLTPVQADGLERLARQVMSQIELRRSIADRDLAARQVREGDTRHRQIIDSAVDYGIITMDLNGDVTGWSAGAKEILGWSESEMLGRPADVFFTPEDVTAGIPDKEMTSARRQGRGNDERWHIRKDGSRFFALGEMMPLTSDTGDHVGYLKILRDRTTQREIEDRLRAADERLQMALAASGVVGLWDWVIDTDRIHGDSNFARLYGLDIAKTAAGLTMEEYQEFVVAEDVEELRRRIRATMDTGAQFVVDYRLAIPGLPLRWVECRGQLIRNEFGKAIRFSGTAVDISARKQAEADLRRLAAIVEQSSEFIGVVNLDGSVAWVNESGRRMVGLQAVDATETRIEDYFDPSQWPYVVESVFPAVLTNGQWTGELRFRHFVTGALIPVIYNVIALRDASGTVAAYATVTRDITEQKDAEARQRVLNEELSHRMKNTLAMVQAIAAQTLRGASDKEAVKAFNKRIHAIAAAHEVLLQENWSAADIASVVPAVLGTFEMGERFAISGPSLGLGPRATLSLSLLLHELATNALKYGSLSVHEGRVEIAWRAVDLDEGPGIQLQWREIGGPAPREPERKGFGSRLITTGLIGTGGSQIRYPQHGLEADFTASLDQIQQS